jgi:hypothetical protein
MTNLTAVQVTQVEGLIKKMIDSSKQSNVNSNKTLEEKVKQLEDKIEALTAALKGKDEQIENLKTSLEGQIATATEGEGSYAQAVSTATTVQTRAIMEESLKEFNEIKSREGNVVIFGLPVNESETDREQIDAIFQTKNQRSKKIQDQW